MSMVSFTSFYNKDNPPLLKSAFGIPHPSQEGHDKFQSGGESKESAEPGDDTKVEFFRGREVS